ncbi:MAG: hypothetical protein K0B02_02875 [DPANN group archaeon]|nr:hypothetical protein [DPANN group archaeon]
MEDKKFYRGLIRIELNPCIYYKMFETKGYNNHLRLDAMNVFDNMITESDNLKTESYDAFFDISLFSKQLLESFEANPLYTDKASSIDGVFDISLIYYGEKSEMEEKYQEIRKDFGYEGSEEGYSFLELDIVL